MAIAAKDVMNLRKQTGLGMMECKAALTETDGDIEKAKDLLRQRGLAKMDSRSDRESAEGRVRAVINDDRSKGAIIEVTTETDFTAGNPAFGEMLDKVAADALAQESGEIAKTDSMQAAIDEVRLTTKENVQFSRATVLGAAGSTVGSYVHFTGKNGALVELTGDGVTDELLADLCMHIVAMVPAPIGVRDEDVPEDLVAKEREVAKAQAIESGKPENIAEKMVEGKVRKFYEEHVLLKQKFVKDDKKRVADLLPDGVEVKSFARYTVGG